ncbi:MAG: hypothetical protein JKY37_01960 [Nannocystaceae bacterium]|nr:hypothetical protein [Nannocystaceae bacterium]
MAAAFVVAQPAHAAGPATSLEVDASALPDGEVTQDLVTRLLDEQTQTLQESGIEVVEQTEQPGHTIRVRVRRYGERGVHYEATVALLGDPEGTLKAERTLKCELCRDAELVARVREEVTRLSGRILYDTHDEAEADGPQEPRTPRPPQPVDKDVGPIGILGGIGIGALVLGVGGLSAGIPLALKPDEVRGSAGNRELKNSKPAGRALLGVGSVLLVTGAIMLAVDVSKRKKRRTALLPSLTPHQVAFVFSTRF